MPPDLNVENSAENMNPSLDPKPILGVPDRNDQKGPELRWVESESPIRLYPVVEDNSDSPRSEVSSGKGMPESRAEKGKGKLERGRQVIYQVLRNDSAPTIDEKIEYRKLVLPTKDLLWEKGVGNWFPDEKLPGAAIFEDEQAAKDYVEKERELYRKQLGGGPEKLAS
jgi:hypothetical protein